jgi:hypothetical protein
MRFDVVLNLSLMLVGIHLSSICMQSGTGIEQTTHSAVDFNVLMSTLYYVKPNCITGGKPGCEPCL